MTADTAPVTVATYASRSAAMRRARQLAARHGRRFYVQQFHVDTYRGGASRPTTTTRWAVAVDDGRGPLWPGARWRECWPGDNARLAAARAARAARRARQLADDDHDEG